MTVHHKQKLSNDQREKVIDFLNTNRGNYSSNQDCFHDALAAAGATGVISEGSSAVARYIGIAKKAQKAQKETNRLTSTQEELSAKEIRRQKAREYQRKRYQDQKVQKAALNGHGALPSLGTHYQVNQCPHCGCPLKAVAVAINMPVQG